MKKQITILAIFIIAVLPLFAAWPEDNNGNPNGGNGPGFSNIVEDTPVDGGIVTVTALAIGYGVRRARKKKEDKNNDQGAI